MVASKDGTAKHRPFLKWAGGKYRLTEEINKLLPKKKSCLIEPFVGAGSVFLNSQFSHYILADLNPDLISLFNIVKSDLEHFIQQSRLLFTHTESNTAHFYYQQRQQFNYSQDPFERACLFLYLNRFGYNGLCRYNSKQQFNVPFGAYIKPYFPEDEIRFFSQKAQSAVFICADFRESFNLANDNCVIYCDPPYAPIQQLTNFTQYSGSQFGLEQQAELADLARRYVKDKKCTVVISNHDTAFTRQIYHGAKIKKLSVQRHISQNGTKREKVKELIAVFKT